MSELEKLIIKATRKGLKVHLSVSRTEYVDDFEVSIQIRREEDIKEKIEWLINELKTV